MKLTMFSDPGHAWLFVSQAQLCTLGLTLKDFSKYSYHDRAGVYAEEDCDAAMVIKKHNQILDCAPSIDYVDYPNETQYIRGLPRCGKTLTVKGA